MRAAGLLNDRFYPLETNVAAAEICHKGGKSHSLRYALSSAERTDIHFLVFAGAASARRCDIIIAALQHMSSERSLEATLRIWVDSDLCPSLLGRLPLGHHPFFKNWPQVCPNPFFVPISPTVRLSEGQEPPKKKGLTFQAKWLFGEVIAITNQEVLEPFIAGGFDSFAKLTRPTELAITCRSTMHCICPRRRFSKSIADIRALSDANCMLGPIYLGVETR